ncbi:PLP-dependent aminotransferase family protein [Paenibacillus barcinonensis]|uniref:GntR family transcriptional regulator/MocR family aminotransferase n=1 Tax=Paenibacillus barcinonensis TaxID=198119 RepID=A0A2V4VPW7_PAEBA|nr:PLP-dependent aminotransferase family protein [Paenibacillus barcinonensis]PYE48253.1 GntR family transcriptional regulator/MocR family aminotransferase [Paenibacillus barcinonensis]QKS56896.1 PLP-dependent aminotransferase family protein [Paenibacillus barcinonensis]
MELWLPLDSYELQHRYKYQALYYALRDAIHSGTLEAGARLPSTRVMAKQYKMSRGSVAQVYDMLLADGYVHAYRGKGTYVTESLSTHTDHQQEAVLPLSPWAERLLASAASDKSPREEMQSEHEAVINFRMQRLQPEHFPAAEWKSALAAVHRSDWRQPCGAAGDLELREAMASHLRWTRGIQTEASQIVLFSGSIQGITLISQLFIAEGSPVVLENPSYPGIVHAVRSCGGQVIPAEVDEGGIIPKHWQAQTLFVTPTRQFPTGAVLGLERRRALLAWASRQNAVIVEDDYDSEFRWGGRPIEPLKVLDREQRVIYVGSFSQTMPASFRLGYAVLPPALVEPLLAAKALYEPVSPALLEQRALARFMTRGGYLRHLRRLTRLYGERHDFLVQEIERCMPKAFTLLPGDAGLTIYAVWNGDQASYERFTEHVHKQGVLFRDVERYRLMPGSAAICFGFAHLEKVEIREGVRRMQIAWEKCTFSFR